MCMYVCIYICIYENIYDEVNHKYLHLEALFVLYLQQLPKTPCLAAIYAFSHSWQYLLKYFYYYHQTLHLCVSVYNANAYEVLSDSYKYFTSASYTCSFNSKLIYILYLAAILIFANVYQMLSKPQLFYIL